MKHFTMKRLAICYLIAFAPFWGGVKISAGTVTSTILEYNYAKLATDNLSLDGSQGVTRVTKNTINSTDVYTFTCGSIITSDDVLLNNGSITPEITVVTMEYQKMLAASFGEELKTTEISSEDDDFGQY